jgi:EmrB/QacA subfamily drug resistance transporter
LNTPTNERADRGKRKLAMIGLAAGVLMGTLDVSIVNVALPTLMKEMDASLEQVQWVIVVYGLIVTSFMLVMGRLGDLWGKKKVYSTGLALFVLGSAACGLSPTIHALIAARAFQAFGAVMMQALATAMITDLFPPDERGRALGLVGGVVSIGLALGPALGGVIVGKTSWHFIFFLNIPVGAAAWLIVNRFAPAGPEPEGVEGFDFSGAGSLLLALICFALGMTLVENLGFGDHTVLLLFLGAVCGGVLFAFSEKRSDHPMCDPSLMRNSQFLLGLVMSFLAFLLIGTSFLLPFYLQYALDYSVTMVGLLMMSIPMTMGLIAPAAGSCSDRWGAGPMRVVGLIVLAGGCLSVATLTAESSPLEYVVKTGLCGLGMGLFQSPNINAVMSLAPQRHRGVASGLLSLTRNLGTSAGVPLMGMLFLVRLSEMAGGKRLDKSAIPSAPPEHLAAALGRAFSVSALLVSAAAVLAVLAWALSRAGNSPSSNPVGRSRR